MTSWDRGEDGTQPRKSSVATDRKSSVASERKSSVSSNRKSSVAAEAPVEEEKSEAEKVEEAGELACELEKKPEEAERGETDEPKSEAEAQEAEEPKPAEEAEEPKAEDDEAPPGPPRPERSPSPVWAGGGGEDRGTKSSKSKDESNLSTTSVISLILGCFWRFV